MSRERDIAVLVGVGLVALYVLRSFVKETASEIVAVPGEIGRAIGGSLYEWLNPYDRRQDVFYTVLFPTGQRHAIRSDYVDSAGRFNYNGQRYTMRVRADRVRVAVPV